MKRIFVGFAILIVCLSPAYAETVQTLTLDEAISIALQNNPNLKSERAKLPVSEAEVVSAKAWPNPSIVSDLSLADKDYHIGGISQTIPLGLQPVLKGRVAKAQMDVVQNNIFLKQWKVRLQVRQAFTALFIAQEKANAAKQIFDNNQQLEKVAIRREEVGKVPYVDVLQARLEKLKAENQYDVSQNEASQAQTQLAFLLGYPEDTPLHVTGLKASLDTSLQEHTKPDELTTQALENRLDLQTIALEKEVNQRELALAKANRIPNIAITAGVDYSAGNSLTSGFLGIGLPIPIFYRQQGEIRKAQFELKQRQLEKDALQKQIKTDIRTNVLTVQQLKAVVDRYESQILPIQREVMDKTRMRYRLGKDPLIVSLNAQQSFLSLTIDYLEALRQYQNAVSQLEFTVGVPLS